MQLYAVIMAGGVGSRFWPRSREKSPKQLLKIFGELTMIQQTVERLEGLVPNERILIVTNKVQKDEIIKQLPKVPAENVIDEPFGRNTAACIGLAAEIIKKKSSDAVTIVLPADHIILEKDKFQTVLKTAAENAYSKETLVTVGIQPTRPETGYGYIQISENQAEKDIFKVVRFAEKPDLETAVKFLESGDFMWNSGMFVWRVDTILNEIKMYLPEHFDGLEKIAAAYGTDLYRAVLESEYSRFKSISIDYGIMEKSNKVFLTKSIFNWSDVGSWEEVYQLTEKDEKKNAAVSNKYFIQNSSNNYVYAKDKFVALVGVDDLIVIDTKDALLVCKREDAQDVKKIVDYLKSNNLTELC